MGSTNCSSCKDTVFPSEAIIQSPTEVMKEARAARHELEEQKISMIQSYIRGYLVKKKISLLLNSIRHDRSHTAHSNLKESLNSSFTRCSVIMDLNALIELRMELSKVYKVFFNICQIDLDQPCVESNISISSLQAKSGEEFEQLNKPKFLCYMREKSKFDFESLLKSKCVRKEEQAIIVEESQPEDLRLEGSSNKTFSKQKEKVINESQLKERVLRCEIQHSSNNNTIRCTDSHNNMTPFSNNSYFKESKLGLARSEKKITYSDNQTQPHINLTKDLGKSESSQGGKKSIKLFFQETNDTIIPYFDNTLKVIQEESLKCSQARIRLSDSYYEGLFDNKLHCKYGIGLYFKVKEDKNKKYKYFGYFQNDLFEGIGIYIRDDGYIYQGEFRNGRRSGYGIEKMEGSYSYKGFFTDDKFNGYGIYHSYEKKATYYGTFSNNLKDGLGFIQFADGSFYSGFWKKNNRSGKGLTKWEEGHSYFGGWIDDKMEGQGTFTWTKGDIFNGSYHSNLRHGYGNYYYKNGSVLQGRWINGKKEGVFSFTTNGKPAKVLYKNDAQI